MAKFKEEQKLNFPLLSDFNKDASEKYDTIYKTVSYWFDPAKGTQRMVDELGALAEVGFDAAIGAVANVWDVTPLEVIGSEVIPVVADF